MKRLNKKEEEDEKCLLLAGPQCGDFRNVSNDVVVLEAYRPDSATELLVKLTHERDIYRFLSRSQVG